MSTQDIRCSGVRLRVHRSGDGAPLLLINGLGASLEMWGPLLAHLPQRDIIAFDLPGAGRSSVPRVPLRMRGIANIVAELMCKLGVGPADVLGCSFGGVVAQELAHRHPTMVNRLILAATSRRLAGVAPEPPCRLADDDTGALLRPSAGRSDRPSYRGRPNRARPRRTAGLHRPTCGITTHPEGLPSTALRHHRMDEPAVARRAPAANIGAARKPGSDRSRRQRSLDGVPHPPRDNGRDPRCRTHGAIR